MKATFIYYATRDESTDYKTIEALNYQTLSLLYDLDNSIDFEILLLQYPFNTPLFLKEEKQAKFCKIIGIFLKDIKGQTNCGLLKYYNEDLPGTPDERKEAWIKLADDMTQRIIMEFTSRPVVINDEYFELDACIQSPTYNFTFYVPNEELRNALGDDTYEKLEETYSAFLDLEKLGNDIIWKYAVPASYYYLQWCNEPEKVYYRILSDYRVGPH